LQAKIRGLPICALRPGREGLALTAGADRRLGDEARKRAMGEAVARVLGRPAYSRPINRVISAVWTFDIDLGVLWPPISGDLPALPDADEVAG